jgi:DNA-binding XRE family transcriptional regulator
VSGYAGSDKSTARYEDVGTGRTGHVAVPLTAWIQRRRVGLNLKKLREEQGYSQVDHCGLHRTYISGIERGICNPTVVILDKIARALKVAPGSLLEETKSLPKRG